MSMIPQLTLLLCCVNATMLLSFRAVEVSCCRAVELASTRIVFMSWREREEKDSSDTIEVRQIPPKCLPPTARSWSEYHGADKPQDGSVGVTFTSTMYGDSHHKVLHKHDSWSEITVQSKKGIQQLDNLTPPQLESSTAWQHSRSMAARLTSHIWQNISRIAVFAQHGKYIPYNSIRVAWQQGQHPLSIYLGLS
ncbi:hypothetical protein BDZ91DRAFT_759501 [Kalaharituber pfeilii]|nr:hypothetical protein BDZ91DRAFT_759501 [Kalaharituber pfeilii]